MNEIEMLHRPPPAKTSRRTQPEENCAPMKWWDAAAAAAAPWLGIPILDSDFWDYRNPEFRFRKRNSGTFRRKKPETLWRESVPS
jgi:hypothetical protein